MLINYSRYCTNWVWWILLFILFVLNFQTSYGHIDSLHLKLFQPKFTSNTELETSNSSIKIDGFALTLFSKQLKSSSIKNQIISPLSVEVVLGMLYNGSDGRTKYEITKAMRQNDDSMLELNSNNANILTELGKHTKSFNYSTANSIWYTNEYELNDEFNQHNTNLFNAKFESVNFTDENIVARINNWLTSEISNMPHVFNNLNKETKILTVNAAYFHGSWKTKFHSLGNMNFTLLSGDSKTIKSMIKSGDFEYFSDDYCEGIRIPYQNDDYFMEVLLPKNTIGINQISEQLTASNWKTWQTSFEMKHGTIIMPIFHLRNRFNLHKLLSTMGIQSLFEDDNVDLSKMFVNEHPSVSNMILASLIDVDTDGYGTSFDDDKDENFRINIDHPFFFTIRNKETSKILFIGIVTSPLTQDD